MAGVTLGQMLEIALGSSRAGAVDFEQLHHLLNGLLLHLGLRDLLVQENGEPLEGAEESPFAFLKDLKQRMEANEKELAEFRTLCQELREEVTVMKEEQSRMAEEMQNILENFDMEKLQQMMEDLRKQVLDSVMASLKDKDDGWNAGHMASLWDDPGLIVIGNEITLLERTPLPRYVESRPSSPLSPSAKDREKDLLEANASNQEDDMGQDTGRKGRGWSAAQSGTGRKGKRWNVRSGDTGQDDTGQDDTGQDDTGQDDTGQTKDEEIKMSISKRKSASGGFTASGTHPGAPGSHPPGQRVQSVQGQPGSHLSTSAEDGAGASDRLPTSKDSRGGRSSRMEPFPAEDALMILKLSSSEYLPCDQLSGRHSETIPSTPPPSPGLSGRLPRAHKKSPKQEEREPGYHRGSPRYCGGRHTSTFPRQPMEPLLPDPNKPGVVELLGKDGLVYRGRTAPEADSPRDSSPQK